MIHNGTVPTANNVVGQKRSSEGLNNGDDGNGESIEQNKKKRRQVKRACLNCRIAHAACDNGRPCARCLQYGLEVSCLDVERKNSKKKKEGTLGQLGTIAGLNHLLQIANPGSMAPPPPITSSSPSSHQYQQETQPSMTQSSQQPRTDIPHNVYLTHEYFPILTQLAAQHNSLLQVIQQQMNEKKATPSPSPSPHHTQQSYNPTYLPPILSSPEGVSMTNFMKNTRASSSGLANIQMQLAQSSPRHEQMPTNNTPNMLSPSSTKPPSPSTNFNSHYNMFGNELQRQSTTPSPPSPPPRVFKPQLLQQAQPPPRLQTPDVFIDTDEIDIVTKNGEDLSSFFIDDYFTKMIAMHNEENNDSLGQQTFDDYDRAFQSEHVPDEHLQQQQPESSDYIKLCTHHHHHEDSSGCVVFPSQSGTKHGSHHQDGMCVAVWELGGSLYSANHRFMEVFKIPKTLKLAKKDPNQALHFENLLPKSDTMMRSMFNSILAGRTPFYNGPIQFIDYEMSKNGASRDDRLNAFVSCYLVRAGVHQEPHYLVTHISIVKDTF